MSNLSKVRTAISSRYRKYGVFSRSLDRLNRLPLHFAYLARFFDTPMYASREALWDAVSAFCPGPIEYLEFGVHRGHSILYWTGLNTEASSRFTGFDTFSGLPETWNQFYQKGHFDTGGQPPSSNDARLHFIVGLFQDTLDKFLSRFDPAGRQLVIHIDCDIYSAALYCLVKLDPWLVKDTILIFDEFGDVQHEFRAFQDYLSSHNRTAKPIAFHDDGYTAGLILC